MTAPAGVGTGRLGTGAELPVTWVIGSGGLLGGALTRVLRRGGHPLLVGRQVTWTDHDQVTAALDEGLDRLAGSVTPSHGWRVAWCAGAGVTGTSPAELQQEVTTLRRFLDALRARSDRLGTGTLFVCSSAGGLYAGSSGAPFTEAHPPNPISAYGDAKLAAEHAAAEFAADTGQSVVVGRIANLYGPGQDLGKGQGFISHLCRAMLVRQPVSVYVSLDTIRDYLYVDDCAGMIADLLARPGGATGRPVVKVLASQHGTTMAELLGECRRVFKRRPLLILGSSPNARFQVRDLRLRSAVRTDIDRRTLTSLPAGIAATAEYIRRTALAGRAG